MFETVPQKLIPHDHVIDIAKGIGILLVVLMHLPWRFEGFFFVRTIVYNFHVPLFFILGGCFIKKIPFRPFVTKKTGNLLIPYIVFLVFFLVFPKVIYMLYKGSSVDTSFVRMLISTLFMANGSFLEQAGLSVVLWFLPCYFVYSVLTYLYNWTTFDRLNPAAQFGALFIAGFSVHYIVNLFMIHDIVPLSCDIALMSLPFSVIGRNYKSIVGLPSGIVFLFLPLLLILSYFYAFDMQTGQIGNYSIFLLLGSIGSCLVIKVARVLSKVNIGRLFNFLGKRSLYIYGLHSFATVWVSFFTIYVLTHNHLIRVIGTFLLDLMLPIIIYEAFQFGQLHLRSCVEQT